MSLRAPYNFVPLNDKVFIPDWGKSISHDIPFEKSVCGSLELEIEALTPLFIRNGHTREDADAKNEKYKAFSNFNGKYFIPATSLKGCLRNVLEIISFSKLKLVSNKRYSIRDLHLNKYLNKFKDERVHCGWMSKSKTGQNTVHLEDCGIPFRISHSEIDEKFNLNFAERFKKSAEFDNPNSRTAINKIKLFGNNAKYGVFRELPINSNNPADKRKKVVYDENGKIKGTIVFTGQSSIRKDAVFSNGKLIKKATGKTFEFVFPEIENSTSFTIDISEENNLFDDFLFIYKDSVDWNEYWKKRFENGERIPVFMSVENNSLSHFGLSYLYKLPYPKRVTEYLSKEHKSANLDLAESIFGDTSAKDSLKGRVQFSHAFLYEGGIIDNELKPYMSSPKPTYYPNYIQQTGVNGDMSKPFKTMLNADAELKGWKRYPVQKVRNFQIPDIVKPEHLSPFIPVKVGSKFRAVVRFHNLREEELGALISSIEVSDGFIHSLGYAKPYGYGQVKVSICKLKPNDKDVKYYKENFKKAIIEKIVGYEKSQQLKELYLMGKQFETTVKQEYMELKEFADYKKQKNVSASNTSGQYLRPYSELIKIIKDMPKQEFSLARITFVQKPLVKATLIGNKVTNSIQLINFPEKVKPKLNQEIIVELLKKGGNITALKYLKDATPENKTEFKL